MRVLGIDPGLNITGYGLLESTPAGPRLLEAGVIRGGPAERPLGERLRELFTGINEVLAAQRPDAVAVEQLYSHIEHPRTSILMGHARGVLVLAAAMTDILVVSYSATQIKKTLTGNGRAPKQQMQLAIQRELKLPAPPEPADVADALAIALCHTHVERIARLGMRESGPKK